MRHVNKAATAAVALLAMAGGSLITPSAAATTTRDEFYQTAKMEFTGENTNGFVAGRINDFAEDRATEPVRTQFRMFVDQDDVDGGVTSVENGEWSVEVYAAKCGAKPGSPLSVQQFFNSSTYGPSMNTAVDRPLLDRVPNGCVYVVHDGPTTTAHALEAGFSGRHVVAQVSVAANTTWTP